MSNVPQLTYTPKGVTVPAESDVLAGVQDDNNAAFGGNLNPALETPQGQLASSLAAIIADKNAQIAQIINQVNPNYSDGRWQDAIAAIYFITRIAGKPTTVTATCNGSAGTVIPVGALVQDGNGNTFSATGAATIGTSGNVDVSFAAAVNGPTPVPASLSVYKAISGWDRVTPNTGVVGRNVETRTEFEARRRQSVAHNAQGYAASVQGSVLALSGVLSCYTVTNPTGTTKTAGGVSLVPHSVYVAVTGGDDTTIAQTIWEKTSIGCNYNGNTTVTVKDSSIGSDPLPTYDVTFQRPTDLPIYVGVTIRANSALPADINALISQAINDAFTGADGGSPAQIGSTVYASRFYAGVGNTSAQTEVISITVGTAAGSATANSQAVNIDQMPTVGGVTVTQQ